MAFELTRRSFLQGMIGLVISVTTPLDASSSAAQEAQKFGLIYDKVPRSTLLPRYDFEIIKLEELDIAFRRMIRGQVMSKDPSHIRLYFTFEVPYSMTISDPQDRISHIIETQLKPFIQQELDRRRLDGNNRS